MISADYCRLFARYNHWQNTSLIAAADALNDGQRWQDMGAFFHSIAATLNHLYWADALILARLNGNERPHDHITHSLVDPSDWSTYRDLRLKRDSEIIRWAARLTEAELQATVAWYPPDGTARVEMSAAACAVQLFNHQTHHRGQIHAMLTAQGTQPYATDISAMPEGPRP